MLLLKFKNLFHFLMKMKAMLNFFFFGILLVLISAVQVDSVSRLLEVLELLLLSSLGPASSAEGEVSALSPLRKEVTPLRMTVKKILSASFCLSFSIEKEKTLAVECEKRRDKRAEVLEMIEVVEERSGRCDKFSFW